ncbi:gel scht [Pseudoduganella sp. FT26W]|uniref:Gel scht n=1 Tax=Duganella aquatilis TaxID=2666082 RepID=A0A844D4E4_9BURK|nr:gel scht [Duganella aquatilis]MRW87733.1 gel scht [Duganella aquatilis]
MKTILLGVVTALALSSLPAAYAQDTSVSVSAARAAQYQMQPDEFLPYHNTYLLENGQKISFDNRLTKLYATLGNARPVRIYATSQTSFVTDDGTRFEFHDGGDALAISDFQKMHLAKNVPANGIMMARR